MSKVTCPECGHEFEVEVRPAEPKPASRRWRRCALALALLLALAGAVCGWLRGEL